MIIVLISALASTLSRCEVNARILDSEGLIDLLYVAYNRDESEVYELNKVLNSGYEELYSTAPDVLDKKMKAIDAQIKENATELAKEVIDDAISAINQLRANDKISDIYIIGHSFGGQLAPVIANKTDVKGVIILAGTTEHIIDVAMNQLKEQNSPYYNVYDPYDEYFRDIKEVVPSEIGYFFMGAYETYWVSYNNINLSEEILSCGNNKKMLVLQGGLDLQVKASELDNYRNLLKDTNAEFKLYETLNHMFVDGTGETITTAYQVYNEIPNSVIEDILKFIER